MGMEEKRYKIYITVFVITTIVASCVAVYFGIMNSKNKKENGVLQAQNETLQSKNEIASEKESNLQSDNIKNENKSESENENVNANSSIKELDAAKVENIQNKFNESNDSKNFFTMLSMYTDKNGISDDGKVMSTYMYYSINKSEELVQNELPYSPSTEEMMSVPLLYSVSYIESIVNNVFAEKLNTNNIKYLQKTEGNLFISLGGFGMSEYVVNSASYDSDTQKYIINYTRKTEEATKTYNLILSYINNNLKIYEIKEV